MENWANKDGLLGLKLPRQRYTVADVGNVWIHGLTAGEKDQYEDQVFKVKAGSREVRISNARSMLIIRTVHDQHGKRIFNDADLGRVCNMPASVVDPMYELARKLSGMPTGEIEEMVKNSEAIAEVGSVAD